jgi:hypothetical protein
MLRGRPSCSSFCKPARERISVVGLRRIALPLALHQPSSLASLSVLWSSRGVDVGPRLCHCSATPPSQADAAASTSKQPGSKKDADKGDIADKLASATSAKDKLELLEQLGARSKNALTQSGMYGAGAPRMVDARVSFRA